MLTMIFAYLAAAFLVALAAWLFGSIIARLFGVFFVLLGLAGTFVYGAHNEVGSAAKCFLAFVGGFALWLAGHWMIAYKHHSWKSSIARRLFNQTPLRRIDPTRRWGTPVVHRRD
ncbi:hypothetical protein [Mycolicibacterium setense]|uniref:hypothetical protein n=1 Tax=Mycolicibacterium setense TaxID=431269 RepID=UPI001F3B4FA2|nr:hypothetical protein [Mycolicibacterium setense]